jgi:hypothetical protein
MNNDNANIFFFMNACVDVDEIREEPCESPSVVLARKLQEELDVDVGFEKATRNRVIEADEKLARSWQHQFDREARKIRKQMRVDKKIAKKLQREGKD